MTLEADQLERVIEAALMAAGTPLSIKKIQSLFAQVDEDSGEDRDLVSVEAIRKALDSVAKACENRGFELKEVGSGFRFQVRQELAPWVNRLWEEKPQKYSRALLETLALIAYRQPITRGDIEEIRGVAVSSHIMKTLVEREWVKVVGHRDVPGRPSLFATTKKFLDYFNLSSLDQLPTLGELRDLDELGPAMNPELDLQGGSDQPQSQPDTQAQAAEMPEDEAVEASVEASESSQDTEALEPAGSLKSSSDSASGNSLDSSLDDSEEEPAQSESFQSEVSEPEFSESEISALESEDDGLVEAVSAEATEIASEPSLENASEQETEQEESEQESQEELQSDANDRETPEDSLAEPVSGAKSLFAS